MGEFMKIIQNIDIISTIIFIIITSILFINECIDIHYGDILNNFKMMLDCWYWILSITTVCVGSIHGIYLGIIHLKSTH